jgi:Pyridoxamine 5'-phosphate oxidase
MHSPKKAHKPHCVRVSGAATSLISSDHPSTVALPDKSQGEKFMKSMTPGEWREFLLFGTRTAKIATVRSNGYPHVALVWFVLDGDNLVFTTGHL